MFIDSHCHLNFPEFKDDLEQALKRANDLGVQGFLTINTRLSESIDLQRIADTYPNVACTVGVHPHDAKDYDNATLKDEILGLAKHPKVVGIGETGLDYFYEHSPREPQIMSFHRHIEVASDRNLPLVIHTRDADADTIAVLDDHRDNAKGVFHCFSGTLNLCKKALDRGFYISISGIVTFKKAENVHAVAKYAPLDRLLVETDAPYLAPIPHRGKRNEPAFVVHTAEYIAELRGIPLPALAEATTANFFNLFTKTKEFFA
ncbi:MAG: TatD family hydrolase [Alphaproteobacteria bacterium]|nr:TatD family hydrolase [Alphaproteobacteria bacterium]